LAAVLKLIEMVVRAGRQANVEVSVCGDMASVPGQVDLLLKAGIRNLSLAPAAVAAVKETVRNWTARSA
jgi:phosphotransferase system enzyme I (PtsI)